MLIFHLFSESVLVYLRVRVCVCVRARARVRDGGRERDQ